jgi:hypothetical protein
VSHGSNYGFSPQYTRERARTEVAMTSNYEYKTLKSDWVDDYVRTRRERKRGYSTGTK